MKIVVSKHTYYTYSNNITNFSIDLVLHNRYHLRVEKVSSYCPITIYRTITECILS